MLADAAPGANLLVDDRHIVVKDNGTLDGALLKADRAERVLVRETIVLQDDGIGHLFGQLRRQDAGLTDRDAWRVGAHPAGNGMGLDIRRACRFAEAIRSKPDRVMRAGFDAFVAARAAREKRGFVDRTWGAKQWNGVLACVGIG